jgi:hypothetical protein
MAFTAGELANIAAATLENHIKQGVLDQSLQERPLMKMLKDRQKTFGGGKGLTITKRVKGVRTTTLQGYNTNDTVTYANPANLKQANYQGKELHAGIQVTNTELKENGIRVVETLDGKRTSQTSEHEKIALADLLNDKISDMVEGAYDDFAKMLYLDGSQDAKEVPGIRSFILDDPTAVGTIGGIDQVANTWWRNRVNLDIKNGGTKMSDFFQSEFRQLRRYTTGAKHIAVAGSDFLDALEAELRANGSYTDSGWAKDGGIDISMSDVKFKGAKFMYDPFMDDNSLVKRCFILDTSKIHLMPMEGEEWKRHNPARPASQYVLYRAMTWTGGLVCWQRNSSGVYAIT